MGLWADLLGTLGSTFAVGAKATRATLTAASLTAARTFTLPDATGTLALRSDFPQVVNKMNWGGKGFNGSTTYLNTNPLTGIADGKAGSIVAIVRFSNAATAAENLLNTTGTRFQFFRSATGQITVTGSNVATGATILSIRSSTVASAAGTYVIMASWDLATPGSGRMWINDVSDYVETTYTNDTIDYTVATWSMGASAAGTGFFTGDIYLMWFDATQRLDFNTESVRRKFTDPNLVPRFLGRNGDAPTGSIPIIFHAYDDVANWNIGRGSATSAWTASGANGNAFLSYQGEWAPWEDYSMTVTITATPHTVDRTTGGIINNVGAACTLTLPSASANRGKKLGIRNIGGAFATNSASSNVVPMAGGAAGTAILAATDGVWCELESTGTNWEIQKN